jgi:hypothetical protein
MMRRLIATASIVVLSLAAATAATGATKARCGTGSVKGIAWVTGGATGLGSLTSAWTAAPSLFGYRWNCSGGAVSVRKPDTEPSGFDVRFAGNPGRVALANAAGGPAAAAVSRNADGSFHVSMAGNASPPGGFGIRTDLAFIVIVF